MELREKAAPSFGRESKKVKLGHSQQDLAGPTTLEGILFPPGPKVRAIIDRLPPSCTSPLLPSECEGVVKMGTE